MFFQGFPGFEGMHGGPGGRMQEDEPIDTNKHYETLGITKDATQGQVKKAFRKLATKYHPDRPTGDEEKFKGIQSAYEILSDPDKRQVYDEYGDKGVQQGVPTDPFSGLFGGPRRSNRKKEKPKAQPIESEVWITLEQVYSGRSVPIDFSYRTAKGCNICE